MIAGRGAFIESLPLFGYDLADHDELFPEKIVLLLRLNGAEKVTWQGLLRPPLQETRREGAYFVGSPQEIIDKLLPGMKC
jgi:hypothetical protein